MVDINELQNLGLSPSEINRVDELENSLVEIESSKTANSFNRFSVTQTIEQGDDVIGKPTGVFSPAQSPGDAVNEISGTANDDDIVGTDFADNISARGGDDLVSGRLGDDTINGGSGDDDLAGQGGNDVIIGGRGSDVIFGDSRSSDDPLESFFGNNSISGGSDRDIIFGGLGNDTLLGNSGKDVLSGGEGNDSIGGGADKDKIAGGEGNDTLNGEAGNDFVYGEDGDDRVFGGNGDDLLYGDRRDSSSNAIGSDTINGGKGNDTLIGGAESDSLNGGSGRDRLIGVEDFQIQFDFGADTIDTLTGGSGRDTFVLGGINENGEEVVFYDDGNPQEQGTDDYALITDFGFGDTFDGVGSLSDYTFGASPADEPSGIGIYSERGTVDELIAIVQSSSFGSASNSTVNSQGLSSVDTLDLSGNSADLSVNDLNLIQSGFGFEA